MKHKKAKQAEGPICSRRDFVKQAAGTVALFSVVPRHVIAGSGETPPSERIRVAAIGCAGRPETNINGLAGCGAEIVGLCDVDTRRTGKIREKFKSAPFFKDYREMLDKLDKQIDGVTVGTPDHWHAAIAIECLRRGKHVQCEKPLAQSFGEVDLMVKEAKASKLVTQAMNQGHAFDSIRTFREWVEAGLIGPVREAHFWASAVYSNMDKLDEFKQHYEIPRELDWELWQGPVTPHRPYCPLYLPGRWRFSTDYGCSTLGDWACHLLDPVFWTLDPDLPDAVTVDSIGEWDPGKHGSTFPKGDRFTLEFPAKNGRAPFKIVWYDGVACKNVPRPQAFGDKDPFPPHAPRVKGHMPEGGLVYGDNGIIQYGSHGAKDLRLLPAEKMEAIKAAHGLPAERYPRVPGGSPYQEWLDAIRKGTSVGSDFAYAGKLTQIALMALAALFDPGKRLEWDRAAQMFKNSAAANARLRVKRQPGFGV
jgi:predicted dehydrogenase